MRIRFCLAMGAALPLLVACTAGPTTSAPVAAAAAGTQFDGRYAGPGMLTAARGQSCGPMAYNYLVTVQNGTAEVIYDRPRIFGAKGPVRGDGSFTLQPTIGDTDLVFSGRIADGKMTGEARDQNCSRSLTLQKQG
ncbi:hypothetical protein [Siccirubricoccus phaeus]|uniref:hypothetical protein n=1 Tax=Siccirubricoccus phaeus TaxID=2595053 RepID=UPI0011F37076|nr:hypothetical protein [Siccirubricoccus phaeus]